MSSFGPEEWFAIVVALAAGGLVKGLTGVGLPLLAVPLLSSFLGVERAVLILVIPAVVLNAYQAFVHRDDASAVPEWPRLVAAGVPGAALGAAALHFASERLLSAALGIWILVYLVFRQQHPSFSLTLAARRRWSPLVGAVAGALQASTGISAPVIAAYAASLGLTPSAYIFAVSAPFGAFAAAHLVVVTASGVYDAELAAQSAFAVLPAIAAIALGARLRARISPHAFDITIRAVLAVMALKLLHTAWRFD